jgi:hypothetical protein
MSQTTPKRATRKTAPRPIESTPSRQATDSEEPVDHEHLESLKRRESLKQIAAEMLELDNEIWRSLAELLLEEEFRALNSPIPK